MTEAVGLLASLTAFVLWLPQARRTWRSRDDDAALRALSAGTFALLLANALLWGLYAVLAQAWWVAAPGLVNAPLAAWMLVLVLRARRREARERAAGPEPLCRRHPGPGHDLVVTAPPGYGYVHSPCTGVQVPGFLAPLGQGAEESRRMRQLDRQFAARADRLGGQ